MLRYKHMRLDQEKIDRVRKILGARTETETLRRALEKVILEDQKKDQRVKVIGQILAKQKVGKH